MSTNKLRLSRMLTAVLPVRLPAWADQLDFVGPRAATAWWAWALLCVGMVVTMGVADQFDTLSQARQDGEAQIKRLARADRQLRLTRAIEAEPVASAASQPEAPVIEGKALDSVATMALLLGYPWGDALTQIEEQSTRRQAVMLAMAADLSVLAESAKSAQAASPAGPVWPVWRLQAAVKDDAAAQAWATGLPGGQLLSRERLSQPFSATAGSYALRASAQGRWPIEQASQGAQASSGADTVQALSVDVRTVSERHVASVMGSGMDIAERRVHQGERASDQLGKGARP